MAKRSDIKIFVACHKECSVPHHEMLYPIQAGSVCAQKRLAGMLHDDDIDEMNISDKNAQYCELTAQYWVWKHVEADYYGLCHYRRFFCFADEKLAHNSFQDIVLERMNQASIDKLGYNADNMRSFIEKYDVILTDAVRLKELNHSFKNNYEQYISKSYEYGKDIEVLLQIIKELFPDYYEVAYRYFYDIDYGYFCNMFIMKKEIFQTYCKWLFSILEEHEKRRDYKDYSIDGYRVSGYLGERLLGIYYLYLVEQGKYKTCELQKTLFLDVSKEQEYKPAFWTNNIPIVMAANEGYAPYCGTLLMSVKECAKSENNYDIYVLSHDMSEKSKQRLVRIVEKEKNFSLRFIDPIEKLEGYQLYTRAHFSIETYYRLILPQVLTEYEKIIYLDADTIVQRDIAELYRINIGEKLLGAVYDIDTAGLYNGFMPDKKKYMDSELGLKEPYGYFQAGVLLMNLKAFRKEYTTTDMLELAASKQWQLLDQDVLNKLCEGKVYYLNMAWNVVYNYGGIRIDKIFRLAPQWQYKMYSEARKNPYVIHYAGPEKPWKFPDCDFAEVFWKYARKTDYYEELLYHMIGGKKKQVTQDKMFIRTSNSPIYKTIRCLRLYGLSQTIRECKNAIKRCLHGKKSGNRGQGRLY